MDPHEVSRRRLLALSASGFAATSMLAAAPRSAVAAYPDRYVTMVVPFAPGGATDLVGRAIAVPLSKLIGQSVLIENRAGAGGNIGITYAGHAAGDGYTLLCTSSAFVVNPSLYSKVTYDPFKDFIPIADLGASPNVIVADPKTGLKGLADLIARAKADPELFNYSSAGAGTTPHLSAELLKIRAGINLTHVPYGGAGPALQGVLSGVTQLGALNLSVALPQINAGTVIALVQTGEKRWVDLPDVPTMEEAGFPNSVSETFQALFAPAGTPADIVMHLSDAAVKAANDPNFNSSMVVVGFGVTGTGSEALRARVTREVPAWKEVIDQAGIRLG
jgi:tripartite-type tricarboxylate transporter receptor subunit TctC